MADSSSRKNFLKYLGLGAGATLLAPSAMANFLKEEEIKRLNPEQHAFMVSYGQWMDEFTEVAKIQKEDPTDMENQKRMMVLSEKVEAMQPELTEHLKDKDFTLIYRASIQRLTEAI